MQILCHKTAFYDEIMDTNGPGSGTPLWSNIELFPLPYNPGQLNQVFLNLLINAGQAIVPPGEIVLKSWHDDDFVYASVSDTGQGIPEEVRDRIFELFFTTRDVGKGTGLGLSISYEIIKKHQGEIMVESTAGKGTTFTVKLPRTLTGPV